MVAATQAVYGTDGRVILEGGWDPRVLASFFRSSDLSGARVLDMGANRAGLSLELARKGASVHAAEPREDMSEAKLIAGEEGLDITFGAETLFDSHTLGRFDVIVCFGLLYHFREPMFLLDYVSSLAAPVLYLSSQVSPGDELKMVNRAAGVLKPEKDMQRGIRGWQPTHPMLRRMLEASGFDEIELLTDREYAFPEFIKGATNSAYYRAENVRPVEDPSILSRMWEPRWR